MEIPRSKENASGAGKNYHEFSIFFDFEFPVCALFLPISETISDFVRLRKYEMDRESFCLFISVGFRDIRRCSFFILHPSSFIL